MMARSIFFFFFSFFVFQFVVFRNAEAAREHVFQPRALARGIEV